MPKRELTPDERGAIERLLQIAMRDTGQSRRVANFLLAWHNAEENGGWDPTDLWAVDKGIAMDMVAVLKVIWAVSGKYPPDWGFRKEIERVWDRWRKRKEDAPEPEAFDEDSNRFKWPEDRR